MIYFLSMIQIISHVFWLTGARRVDLYHLLFWGGNTHFAHKRAKSTAAAHGRGLPSGLNSLGPVRWRRVKGLCIHKKQNVMAEWVPAGRLSSRPVQNSSLFRLWLISFCFVLLFQVFWCSLIRFSHHQKAFCTDRKIIKEVHKTEKN